MPEVVKDFTFFTPRGVSKYESLMDGQAWKVTTTEYGCKNLLSLRSGIEQIASRRGKRVHMKTINEVTAILQVYDIPKESS